MAKVYPQAEQGRDITGPAARSAHNGYTKPPLGTGY